MKKLVFVCILALSTFANAQISITTNLPDKLSPGQEFVEEITIDKGTVSNFAKFQQDAPAGFIVEGTDTKSGNFTYENQRAKIVWVSIPGEAKFTIKLKIKVPANYNDVAVFPTHFFYLEGGVKKDYEMPVINVKVGTGAGSPAVASEPVKTEPVAAQPAKVEPVKTEPVKVEPVKVEPVKTEPVKVVKTEPVKTEPVKTEPVKTEPIKEVPITITKPKESTPEKVKTTPVAAEVPATAKASSGPGTVYRVQIGAYDAKINVAVRYPSLSGVTVSEEDGKFKYLIGNYKTREEASKKRDDLKAAGINAFVVIYMNGSRSK